LCVFKVHTSRFAIGYAKSVQKSTMHDQVPGKKNLKTVFPG